MDNKTISYKRFVAQQLIQNTNNSNKVISLDGDQFNTHPSNLKWIWTRENRNLTTEEALQKCKDDCLKEYYKTGDKKTLRRSINNIFEYDIKCPDKNKFIGELYLLIDNYLDRNLLFSLKDDIIITLWGLKKQQYRKRVKSFSIDGFDNIDKTNILCDNY